MIRPLLSLSVCAALLGACATNNKFEGDVDADDAGDVLMTPVTDLNIDKVEIPVILTAMSNPYADPPSTCEGYRSEIDGLNRVMGEDLNIPEDEAERREKLANAAAGSAVGSLIPFRGVVRAISGASSHERDVRDAHNKGLVRRAYLKGLAEAQGCVIPVYDPIKGG